MIVFKAPLQSFDAVFSFYCIHLLLSSHCSLCTILVFSSSTHPHLSRSITCYSTALIVSFPALLSKLSFVYHSDPFLKYVSQPPWQICEHDAPPPTILFPPSSCSISRLFFHISKSKLHPKNYVCIHNCPVTHQHKWTFGCTLYVFAYNSSSSPIILYMYFYYDVIRPIQNLYNHHSSLHVWHSLTHPSLNQAKQLKNTSKKESLHDFFLYKLLHRWGL